MKKKQKVQYMIIFIYGTLSLDTYSSIRSCKIHETILHIGKYHRQHLSTSKVLLSQNVPATLSFSTTACHSLCHDSPCATSTQQQSPCLYVQGCMMYIRALFLGCSLLPGNKHRAPLVIAQRPHVGFLCAQMYCALLSL